jgi:hypothetical protein
MSALYRVFSSDWGDFPTSSANGNPLAITNKTSLCTLDRLHEFVETGAEFFII